MEEPVTFDCKGIRLSGLLQRTTGDRAALVTHPHPLYGGNMYNSVVETITRAYQSEGYSTLRFDFRGTGKSQGVYSNGREEPDDVAAAISYLHETGINHLHLAGYSFGAWICALGAGVYQSLERMILVSPPVALIDFKDIQTIPALAAVITGSEDEFAPPEIIKTMMPAWNPEARFHVIDNADHFYFGFDRKLEKLIAGAIRMPP